MKRVFLVDDEREMTELTSAFLRMNGFEVEASNDSAEALERLKTDAFSAVIVDLMMFPMDGMELLRRVRELPGHAATPLYVMSCKPLTDLERKDLLRMRVTYFSKPMHPRLLAQRLKTELGP